MKKRLLVPILLLYFTLLNAQVGIGTLTPDASSALDISTSNKGVLVPRVSLSNVTASSIDGVNTAATGLLIWNNNSTTTGGDGIGYYYYNGTIWEKVQTTATNSTNTVASKYRASASYTLANGVYRYLNYNTTSFSIGGGSYNTTNGTYTVPEDGIYEIKAKLNVGFNSSGPREMSIMWRLMVNGTIYEQNGEQGGATVTTSYRHTFRQNFTHELSAGDEVRIRVFPAYSGSTSPSVFGGGGSIASGTNLVINKIN